MSILTVIVKIYIKLYIKNGFMWFMILRNITIQRFYSMNFFPPFFYLFMVTFLNPQKWLSPWRGDGGLYSALKWGFMRTISFEAK